MSLPLIIEATTPIWTCVHGGTFSAAGSGGTAQEGAVAGAAILLMFGDAITPVAPCPGIPPSGIPPCLFPLGVVATSAFKKEVVLSYATIIDLQISASGFPLPPATTPSTKVFVIG